MAILYLLTFGSFLRATERTPMESHQHSLALTVRGEAMMGDTYCLCFGFHCGIEFFGNDIVPMAKVVNISDIYGITSDILHYLA